MNGPPEIWLDPRVIQSMKTEPDPDATVPLVRYMSDEHVGELMTRAIGGTEFLIQIVIDDRERTLIGLTNYGRLFYSEEDAEIWRELETPNLEESPR